MTSRGRMIATCLFALLLTVGFTCRSTLDHADLFTRESLLEAQSTDLQATTVTAHLEVPLREDFNALWCGTWQLAWNEACSLIKEDLKFEHPQALVDQLNKHAMTRTDLDAASYLALAGFVRDNIHERIGRKLNEKFGGRATPGFIPPKGITPRPQDIVAYAYLFKNLEFATPFERLDTPLVFGQEKVASFGMGAFKPEHYHMISQVQILDYKTEQDFVIELRTKSTEDRMILAKTAADETLSATVKKVLRRIDKIEGKPAFPGDILKIPKLNFDITHSYHELMGQKLVTRNPAVAKDLRIVSAVQNTRFQMDEKGVRLRSESHVAFTCAKSDTLDQKHIMIFDKPFLILLKRAEAQTPYFALWIGNPELLVRW